MTLFANVLQNPQDARARSDVNLMNQVVNFLSLLSVTEEQGGVKRMLGVCTEFERIAKCVLDKTDKSSRHKRKSSKTPASETGKSTSGAHLTPQERSVQSTPQSTKASHPSQPYSQNLTPEMANQAFNPSKNSFSPQYTNIDAALPNFPDGQNHDGTISDDIHQPSTNPEGGGPLDAGQHPMPDMSHFPTDNPTSPLNMGAFQQPFVPQDLWNMNMTLEWDWADMNGGFEPSPHSDQFPASDHGQPQAQEQACDGAGKAQAQGNY